MAYEKILPLPMLNLMTRGQYRQIRLDRNGVLCTSGRDDSQLHHVFIDRTRTQYCHHLHLIAVFQCQFLHATRALNLNFCQILRMPLLFFPIIIASTTDAVVALARIGKFLSAEELAEPFLVDEESKNAIEVDGTFTWETAGKPTPENLAHTKKGHQSKDDSSKITPESTTIKASRWKRKSAAPVDLPLSTVQNVNKDKRKSEVPSEEVPFELKDLKLKVPKGSFVAIVSVRLSQIVSAPDFRY